MRQRGRLTGIAAAQQRLRTAKRILADACANTAHVHDYARLERDIDEAERLLAVAHERAEADVRIAREKAAAK
jgi:hypothetical protein